MKIAIVAESFLPHMNGVTGSVLQIVRHFSGRGHEVLIIAPDSGPFSADLHGARTELMRSIAVPSYPEVRVAFVRAGRLAQTLRAFAPDIVHLASPFVLGWSGLRAAASLGIPTVAVYQTDVTSYAEKYGVPGSAPLVAAHIGRLHRRATLTLVPSSSAHHDLAALGVERMKRWGRGVDVERFSPGRRSHLWRGRIAPNRHIIGYVGRLAPEKQVEDLHVLQDLPGAQLVIVGDGPSRGMLERLLPRAIFTGQLSGAELATTIASFDLFVHPGESETFGQTLQEGFASGVPVIATGRGGPLDIVRNSIDGWLYTPGNLDEMRSRVEDLLGDGAKRAAFARAARTGVERRTWPVLCEQLLSYYSEAIALHRDRAPARQRAFG